MNSKEKVSKKKVVEIAPVPPPTTPPNQVDFYTLDYIALCWGLTDRYLRDQIKNGKLKAKTIANQYIVLHTDLIAFIAERPYGVFDRTKAAPTNQ
jgi:hypothetical protein